MIDSDEFIEWFLVHGDYKELQRSLSKKGE